MQKVAIITGNGAGLGQALSEHITDLGYEKPEILRSKDYNIKKIDDCQRLIDAVLAKYGRLDLLINNVGNYINKPISEFSFEEWHEMIDSNLNSAFYLSKLAIPHLRKSQGRILNIGYSGMASISPVPNVTAYQAAKTALLALTRGMAQEEAKHGVLVNMMSPGCLENSVDMPGPGKIPIGRLGTLDEAVDACFFLIQSDYITGQNLELAGGWRL